MTRRPLPRARVVVLATLALFLAAFALLVFQLRSGRDPALGRTAVAATTPPTRHVLVRKVIVTRVVVHLPEEDDAPAPVVSTRTVPVAPVVPVAPAPAPLTTHSS
jgi:hypothetical protein